MSVDAYKEDAEKPPVYQEPPQKRPFFPSDDEKRIDFVLAFDTSIDDKDKLEHRQIFMTNLKERYSIEVEEPKSNNMDNVGFYLLHVPFEQLEVYANEISLNKAISDDYIKLVDNIVMSSDSSADIHKDLDIETIKDRLVSVPEDNRDILDVVDNKKGNIGKLLKSINDIFAVKHELLKEEEPTFTTVYHKDNRSLFQSIYLKNQNGRNDQSLINSDGFFTPAERSQMAFYILQQCPYIPWNSYQADKTSDSFGIMNLINLGAFRSAYPLHDCSLDTEKLSSYPKRRNMRLVLFQHWGRYRNFIKLQPLDHIRNYFGIKIGLYFAWLGFYTRALMWASIFGLIPFFYGLATLGSDPVANDYCRNENTTQILMCPICETCPVSYLKKGCAGVTFSYIFDNRMSLYYAVIMSLWTALFLEFWKRRQFQLAYDWDLTDIDEDAEAVRPQYRARASDKKFGVSRSNPVTLKKEMYIPLSKKVPRFIASMLVLAFWIVIVLIATVSVIVYRIVAANRLASNDGFKDLSDKLGSLGPYVSPSLIASVTAALISVTIIVILSVIYNQVALKMTEWECHRTETKYEKSLTKKMFWFQFVNYYSPLVYIAFFKDTLTGVPGNYNKFFGYRWHGCEGGGCTYELAVQLVVIMVAKQFALNIVEMLIPFLMLKLRAWRSKKKGKANLDLARWEQDFNLEPVAGLTLFYEYLEMIIQYGFVTLFVTAFPLAPLLALLNNVLEIRLDASKFLKYRQRVVAAKAMNIGAWEDLLGLLSKLGVVTNGFIIALTSDTIPKMVFDWDKKGDGYDMTGYLEHSLSYYDTQCFNITENTSYNLTAPDGSFTSSCAYRGHRERVTGSDCQYAYTVEHWRILCTRFIFVIVMEHLVFAVVAMIDNIIPDRSKKLESEIKREKHITRVILRQFKVFTHYLQK